MITFNTFDVASDNMLEVNLYSNRYELDITIGSEHFGNTMSLDKEQLSELIAALVEMNKEMIE